MRSAIDRLGGELIAPELATPFWTGMRDQTDEFFDRAATAIDAGAALWRLAVPQTAPPLALPGPQLIEWGGAQRWLCTTMTPAALRDVVARAGGHATLFMARDKSAGVFAPLKSPLDRIHRELKKSFDPSGLFNAGRLYPGL